MRSRSIVQFLALPPSGAALVNGDDARASAELLRSPASRWTRYGSSEGVDVRLVAPRTLPRSEGKAVRVRVIE